LTLRGEPDNKFEKISKEYAKVMPGVEGIRAALPYKHDDDHTTVVVDEKNYDSGFTLDEISAGSKEILTLITQIVTSTTSDLLFIEEPELHLHPGAERSILDLIKSEFGHKGPQVILSTHSSIFIHHLDVENVYRVNRDGDTTLRSTPPTKVGADLRELGYEYAGMFQSEGVVIVEGLTDRVALKEIGSKYGLRFDDYNIGVLTMGSGSQLVSNSRPVVRLLDLFNIPYFFVCDSDIGSELKDDDGNPAETPGEIEGRLVGHMNSDTSRQKDWNDITIDDVHAWEDTEIEHYLLQDRDAVKRTFNQVDEDTIDRILDETAGLNPDDQLEEICEEARTELGGVTGAMDKKSDVSDLATAIKLEGLPSEFHDTMEKIAKLVNAQHIISENRPDSGDQT
jgi:predicted ATP-dependent endonuclease of OLD family